MIKIECCDNLELMSKIESGTVDLIYCDILYGTGRKFADYQDLKPIRSEIENHYIPRIKEMHRILKDTGSIYLQMDTRINHWMRCIMDDVFGYDRFLNEIIWYYNSMSNTKNRYPKKHDCILFYSKTMYYKFNHEHKSLRKEYALHTISRSKTKAGFNNDKANYLNGNTYLVQDVWVDINFLKNGVKYNTQKPKALIERIINASSNEGDLIADFYLGSGTTAEVCKNLNRNFVGCDINPRAVELSKMRCGISF
jgi:site-specific DNA-methyltransferase (adenine-specific)